MPGRARDDKGKKIHRSLYFVLSLVCRVFSSVCLLLFVYLFICLSSVWTKTGYSCGKHTADRAQKISRTIIVRFSLLPIYSVTRTYYYWIGLHLFILFGIIFVGLSCSAPCPAVESTRPHLFTTTVQNGRVDSCHRCHTYPNLCWPSVLYVVDVR